MKYRPTISCYFSTRSTSEPEGESSTCSGESSMRQSIIEHSTEETLTRFNKTTGSSTIYLAKERSF